MKRNFLVLKNDRFLPFQSSISENNLNVTIMGLITNIDYTAVWNGIKTYTKKVGRVAARPVLLLYYVMKSEDTPMKDKLVIFGALAYVILPIDLLNAKRLPIIGLIDEVVSLAVAVQRMQKYITPAIEMQVDAVLDRWLSESIQYEEVPE